MATEVMTLTINRKKDNHFYHEWKEKFISKFSINTEDIGGGEKSKV